MCVACCIVCAVNHVLYCARLAFGNVCIVGCVVWVVAWGLPFMLRSLGFVDCVLCVACFLVVRCFIVFCDMRVVCVF